MLPDRVSNPGPLTYESGALPIALCDPAGDKRKIRALWQTVQKLEKYQIQQNEISPKVNQQSTPQPLAVCHIWAL